MEDLSEDNFFVDAVFDSDKNVVYGLQDSIFDELNYDLTNDPMNDSPNQENDEDNLFKKSANRNYDNGFLLMEAMELLKDKKTAVTAEEVNKAVKTVFDRYGIDEGAVVYSRKTIIIDQIMRQFDQE